MTLLLLALACTPEAPATPDATTPTPTPVPSPHTGQACLDNPLHLLTTGSGAGERYYVEIEREGEPAALQFDTGSGLTFLFSGSSGPAYTPDYGDIDIGCETVPVAGRGFDLTGDQIAGLPVVGLLGMDFLLDRPTRLDITGRTLVRLDALPPAAGSEIPFDIVLDHALFPLTIDGTIKRLMFDTGGGDTLLVGEPGQPGDTEVFVQDFEGNVFPIYEGSGILELGDLPARTIPVARAPEFPYFEGTVQALGGNLHGLLGVTAFPGEQLTFDGTTGRMWVE